MKTLVGAYFSECGPSDKESRTASQSSKNHNANNFQESIVSGSIGPRMRI